MLVGAALRFATLDLQSFSHDEAVTAARVLQPGLGNTVDAVADSERNPPLYYLLAWLWSQPFGLGEVGLRSLSALLGAATVPFAYLAGKELVSRQAGLIACWLVAVNPFLIFYSQEARSYALVALLGTIALWLFALSLPRPSNRNLAWWAAASSLALCSHYFAVFPFAVQAAVLVLRSPPRRRVAVAVAVPVVVGLALLPLALDQGSAHEGSGGAPGLNDVTTVPVQFLLGERLGISGVHTLTPPAGLLFFACVGGLIALAWRRRQTGALLSGAIAVAAIGGPLLLALGGADSLGGDGLFSGKNAIGAVVPLSVLAAFGFTLLPEGMPRLAAAGAACFLLAGAVIAATSVTGMQRPDWRAAASAIPDDAPSAIVGGPGGDDPLLLYLEERGIEPMPDEGATVRTISVAAEESEPDPADPPEGFESVAGTEVDAIEVRTYRVQVPRKLTPELVTTRSGWTVLLLPTR